jgi:excisionase family DNA binding protein
MRFLVEVFPNRRRVSIFNKVTLKKRVQSKERPYQKMETQRQILPERLILKSSIRAWLGVSKDTLNKMIHNREIPHIVLSTRVIRFRRADVEAFLARKTRSSEGQSFETAPCG